MTRYKNIEREMYILLSLQTIAALMVVVIVAAILFSLRSHQRTVEPYF
jgi:hypothetical protein